MCAIANRRIDNKFRYRRAFTANGKMGSDIFPAKKPIELIAKQIKSLFEKPKIAQSFTFYAIRKQDDRLKFTDRLERRFFSFACPRPPLIAALRTLYWQSVNFHIERSTDE